MTDNISVPYNLLFRALSFINLQAVHSSTREISAHFRRSCCEFQREYTNYWFTCARLHRDFKDAFKSDASDLNDKYRSLRDGVEDGLMTLCGDQATGIKEYFLLTHRSRTPPRVGVHVMGDDNKIVNLIMLPNNEGNVAHKTQEDYTIFEQVVSTGRPYLDNNLPKTSKCEHAYKHAGLNLAKVKTDYKLPFVDKRLISRWRGNIFRSSSRDLMWDECWHGNQGPHYKSHLAVPITFRAHAERKRLNRRLVEVLELPDGGRSILGFVFLDHPATYYFDDPPAESYENLDINAMYLFADTLSLVMLTALNYLNKSTSVKRYLQQLGDN